MNSAAIRQNNAKLADGGPAMALVDRLSKLDAPDREVDAEIVFDLIATPVGHHKEDGGPTGYIDLADQPSWNLGMRFPGKDKAWFAATRKQIKGETLLIERDSAYVLMNSIRVPELTASVDAAIALAERVLPFTHLVSTYHDDMACSVKIHCCPEGLSGEWKFDVKGDHEHLAVAYCIAILRAIALLRAEEASK